MGTTSRLLHPTVKPVNPLCSMSRPSRKSMRNPRPGTPYGLVTLFADSDEFDIRCSHELSAHDKGFAAIDLGVENCRRVRAARRERQPGEHTKQPSHFEGRRGCPTKALEKIGASATRDSPSIDTSSRPTMRSISSRRWPVVMTGTSEWERISQRINSEDLRPGSRVTERWISGTPSSMQDRLRPAALRATPTRVC